MAILVADATTQVDFVRYRGNTKVIVLELVNDTNDLNITSWTFDLYVDTKPRPGPSSASNLFTLAGTITNAIQTSASNPCTVEFAPSAGNVDQEPGVYYHNVRQVDAAGKVDPAILAGKLIFHHGTN